MPSRLAIVGVRFALVDLRADEARQVERRQAVALLVLGNLRVGIGRRIAHDHGHFFNPARLAARSRLAPKWIR